MKKTLKASLALVICIVTILLTMSVASAIGSTNVRITAKTHNSITVAWDKVYGADLYQLAVTTNGKNWTTGTFESNVLSFTHTGLPMGTAHGYRVRAVDQTKNIFGQVTKTTYGAWSSMKAATTLVPAVKNFKVAAVNHNAVKLVWDKVSGVDGYTVQFSTNGKNWYTYKSLTANSVIVTGLKLGTTYKFRMAAVKIVNKKWVYGPIAGPLDVNAVLAKTGKVALTGVSANAVRFAWLGVSGATGYEVYRSDLKEWVDVKKVTYTTFFGLEPGETYSFKVRAYSGTFKGAETELYNFKTCPAVAQNIKITDATTTSATISWDAPAGVEGYQVRYANAANKITYLPLTKSRIATISNLNPNEVYRFQVRAYAKNTNVHNIAAEAIGAWSPIINFSAGLSAPTGFSVDSANTNSTVIALKWNPVNGATGYIIEKYDLNTKTWYPFNFNTNTWTSYKNVNLISTITTPLTTFIDNINLAGHNNSETIRSRTEVYRLKAVSALGFFGTATEPLNASTNDVEINTNALEQTIKFPAVKNAASYYILTSNTGVASKVIGTYTQGQYSVSNGICSIKLYLSPNTIHSLTILAKDANNKSAGIALNKSTFKTNPLNIITNKNDPNYNKSVHSQLLYAAQSINNTKQFSEPLTISASSEIAYSINSLKVVVAFIPLVDAKSPEEVKAAMAKFDKESSESLDVNSVDKTQETLSFDKAEAKLENGKKVTLTNFLEPTTSTKVAYLPKEQDPADWKNGFSSVSSVKNADGSTTVKLTFKQEGNESKYHNGFMSTFASSNFNEISGFKMTNSSVGASTLTLKISPEGILQSYSSNAPFTSGFSADFEASVSDDDGLINAGDLIQMDMNLSGTTVFKFDISKTK